MCKITDWFSSHSKKKKAAQQAALLAQQKAAQAARQANLGQTEQETATNAKVNTSNDKSLTSLRVPLSTEGTGGNVDNTRKLGLNLLS